MTLEPLDSINYFCRCGITAKGTPHQCTAEPIEPESFWDWTPADLKWGLFAIAALIVFVAIGVSQ